MKREYKIEEWYSEESFNELWAEWWELFIVDTNRTPLFIFRRQINGD